MFQQKKKTGSNQEGNVLRQVFHVFPNTNKRHVSSVESHLRNPSCHNDFHPRVIRIRTWGFNPQNTSLDLLSRSKKPSLTFTGSDKSPGYATRLETPASQWSKATSSTVVAFGPTNQGQTSDALTGAGVPSPPMLTQLPVGVN